MGLLSDNVDEGMNFADVQAPTFEPVKAGWYGCAITNTELRTTSAESKKYPNCPMINVEFTVQEGDNANRKFWRNYLLHPDFAGFLKQLFIAAGWSEDEVNESDFDPEADELEGRELDVRVNKKKSDYSGDMENNVTGVAPAGSKAKGSKASGGDSLMP
jgi:hypothetical protein